MPKVNVIVTTYNRSRYLKSAIDSVLSQTYRDFGIVIVDDGSTDGTEDIVNGYMKRYSDKIRYFRQANCGQSAAMNRGLREARGEYISFLDSDDIYLPERLEVYMRYFESNPDVALIAGKMAVIDTDGAQDFNRVKPVYHPGNDLQGLIDKGSCATSSIMVRQKVIDDAVFDETLYKLTDLDFCINVASKYKILNIDDILTLFREHDKNSSRDRVKSYKNQVLFWKKVIEKYRDKADTGPCGKNVARYYYLLGKEYFIKKDFKNSMNNIFNGIRHDLLLGKSFWRPDEFVLSKAFKLVKPYGLLLINLFLTLLRK